MAQTQTLSINQLQREIQKLERELVILKRTNLWSIDRRVSQLLRALDDSPKSLEKSRLRGQLLAIAATALISFNLANSQDYSPNFDWFKPSVEQIQEAATTPEVKPEFDSAKPVETLHATSLHLTPFAQKINQVARNINADPIDLATLISFETAGTFSPSIRGPVVKDRGRAVGLIQFMPFTAAELGTTSEALAQMSQVEQMDYVERYLVKRGFKGGGLKQLYSTVFAGHPNARGSISDGYHTLDSAVERMNREHRGRAIALLSVETRHGASVLEKTPDQINKSHIYKWAPQFQKNPQLGDVIAGYKVSSPRGWRIHPISGKRQYHQGVDLATPAGTVLYAIADGWVECARGDAAGLYATFTSEEFPTLQFKLLHLSRCLVEPGQKVKVSRKRAIAWTGNSGGSTGPHLDLRIKSSSSGNWLRVRAGWLQWFVTGEQP